MRIRQLGDPILRQLSKPVKTETISNGDHKVVIKEMKSILDGIQTISPENGNAISAPQVGQLIRLILLRVDGEFIPMFNPEFRPLSQTTFEFEEECFSFYNLRAKVTRYSQVEVIFLDEFGASRKAQFFDEEAAIVQHEIDHLDGILFLDKVKMRHEIQSIDYVFAEQPKRLSQIKEMFSYMVS